MGELRSRWRSPVQWWEFVLWAVAFELGDALWWWLLG